MSPYHGFVSYLIAVKMFVAHMCSTRTDNRVQSQPHSAHRLMAHSGGDCGSHEYTCMCTQMYLLICVFVYYMLHSVVSSTPHSPEPSKDLIVILHLALYKYKYIEWPCIGPLHELVCDFSESLNTF